MMTMDGVRTSFSALVFAFCCIAPFSSTPPADERGEVWGKQPPSCSPCICDYRPDRRIFVNCDRRNLSTVPGSVPSEAFALTMQFNNMTNVTVGMFKNFRNLNILSLAHNKITGIDDLSFATMTSLSQLDLQGNMLNTTVLRPSVFSGLHRLQTLKINNNSNMGDTWIFPSQAFGKLTSLKTLAIDWLSDRILGHEFSTLAHLEELTMSGHAGECSLKHLLNDSFQYLSRVKTLDLSKCSLVTLETGVFLPLRSLRTLDLSDNVYLGFSTTGRAAYSLKWTQINVLKINNIYPRFAVCVDVTKEHLKYFQFTNLTELQVDGNRLQLLEKGALALLPRTLTNVSAKNNDLTFGPYLFDLRYLTNVKSIDLSNKGMDKHLPSVFRSNARTTRQSQPAMHVLDDASSELADFRPEGIGQMLWWLKKEENNPTLCTQINGCVTTAETLSADSENEEITSPALRSIKLTFVVPPNITEFKMKWMTLYYSLDEFGLTRNNLQYIDLSCNLFFEWYGPIHGTGKVLHLDLSGNFAHFIHVDFFQYFTSLKTLIISHNILHKVLARNVSGKVFSRLPQLETLDVSYNRLTRLHENLMQGLHSLQKFNCADNMLQSETLNVNILPAKNLTFLNFSSNYLQSIPPQLRQNLDLLVSQNVSIDISDNPLSCDCSNLDFFTWMGTSRVNFLQLHRTRCVFPDKSEQSLQSVDDVVIKQETMCTAPKAAQVAGLVFGILLFTAVVVGCIVFRFRWKLYYLYYVARNQSAAVEAEGEEEAHFLYDAFVVLDMEDRHFVHDQLRLKLEEEQGLRLCLPYRDLTPGRFELQSTVEAIHNSRRTVCLLTANFLDSNECRFMFEMARMESLHENRDVVLFVLKDHVISRSLPRDILYYIKTESYVEYPRDERCVHYFWDNLIKALNQMPAS